MSKSLMVQGIVCILTALGLSAMQFINPSTLANAVETSYQAPGQTALQALDTPATAGRDRSLMDLAASTQDGCTG